MQPNIIVIHYTATHSLEEARATLCHKDSKVSAHYLISEDGTIFNLVDEAKRAWHAGASKWGSITDINSHSIGIELSNDGYSPFGEKLMMSLELLLDEILKKWDIPVHRVLAHSDVSPGRKVDPGVKFDWDRLALKNLAIKPKMLNVRNPNRKIFLNSLGLFGYNEELPYETLLSAFRLRFNPLDRGILNINDNGLAKSLSLKYPVDVDV